MLKLVNVFDHFFYLTVYGCLESTQIVLLKLAHQQTCISIRDILRKITHSLKQILKTFFLLLIQQRIYVMILYTFCICCSEYFGKLVSCQFLSQLRFDGNVHIIIIYDYNSLKILIQFAYTLWELKKQKNIYNDTIIQLVNGYEFNMKNDCIILVMITKGEILAFLGLLNGMIGGTILVLPLLGINTGYLLIPCISLLYGSISFYTCYLIVHHLGECKNIKQVILQHFNNKHSAVVVYNFIIGLSLVGILINYFMLIVKQIQGFIPPSQWIGLAAFAILIVLTVVMRYFSFGERLLAIGILSIVGYLGFLTWAQATAPHQPKTLPPTGPRYIDLAASLIMGYSIHDFVVQVLFKTTTNDKFKKVVFMVYIAGTIIYTYISYGAYAIINRKPRVEQPQTIGQYFPFGSWQVRTIQFLYLFHLLSATPQFCLIMRARFLQMFKIDETPHITIPQFLIYFLQYALCYGLYLLNIKIATVIQINGSVIGFLYVFLIPIVIHIKCVYFNKHDQKGQMICQQKLEDGQIKIHQGKCKCKLQYKNNFTKISELIVQILILLLGGYTIYYTLHLLFWATQSQTSGAEL